MKKLIFITLLPLMLFWHGIAFANQAEFDRGMDAWVAINYSEAVAIWKPLAEQGHAKAQFWLGNSYELGRGIRKDKSKAIKLYKKAYATWKPLAEQGDAEAQLWLGILFINGNGVPKSAKIAVEWYRKSAEQGHARAQRVLGGYYYEGKIVPQDYNEALKWYRLSVKQGNVGAQFYLGHLYANGHGVPQNDILAYMWYSLVSTNGSGILTDKLMEEFAEKLTSAELEQAKELAAECFVSNYKNCE